MATNYNPKIVTDDLMIFLDAGNPRSYPQSGNTWTDLINGAVGTLDGSQTFSEDNGGGLIFNGTTTWCDIDTTGLGVYQTEGTTICATCFRTAVSTSQENIISYRSGGGNLYIGSQSGTIFSYESGLETPSNQMGSFPSNEFIYITVRIEDDGTLTHMTNAGQKAQAGPYTGYDSDVITSIRLSNDLEFFGGTMFNFQHYNRALTDAEISQNFNAFRSRYGI